MEITYIKRNGEERTLTGFQARLFLFRHMILTCGFSYYFDYDLEYLHIKNVKFHAVHGIRFHTNSHDYTNYFSLVFENCEFSTPAVDISFMDIVQFESCCFLNDSIVRSSFVNEVELSNVSSEYPMEYFILYGKKAKISGDFRNVTIKADTGKTFFSNVSNCYAQVNSSEVDVLDSSITFDYFHSPKTIIKNSHVIGETLNFPSLTIQNSVIESNQYLTTNGTTYYDDVVRISDAILSEDSNCFYPNRSFHLENGNLVLVNSMDYPIGQIVELLSVLKALHEKCSVNRVEEMSVPSKERYQELIFKYQREIDELEKKMQIVEERQVQLKEIIGNNVASIPIKRVLK